MVEYNYDAWGNFVAEKVREVCIGSVTVDLVSLNAFTYRGYYYDKESGLYYLINRYYDPTTGRYIQPSGASALNLYSNDGSNLYTYANNNPICKSKKSEANVDVAALKDALKKPIFLLPFKEKHYLKTRWKNKFFDIEDPSFCNLTNEGFELLRWGLTIYNGRFALDDFGQRSFYISIGNLSTYAGINYKKGIGIDLGGSVFELGFEGKFINVGFSIFTVGVSYMYKDGEFKWSEGLGLGGFSISIDFVKLYNYFFGG